MPVDLTTEDRLLELTVGALESRVRALEKRLDDLDDLFDRLPTFPRPAPSPHLSQ